MQITPATPDEREWAASLLAGSNPWIRLSVSLERCREACDDPQHEVFVACDERGPCGVILLNPSGLAGSPYVKSIAVAADRRSQGIGGALMDFAEDRYRERARFLFLCVSSFNTRARSFYEARGFAEVGELPDYVVEGESEILMQKRLR